jgi:DNA-binding NtrC family response regulator
MLEHERRDYLRRRLPRLFKLLIVEDNMHQGEFLQEKLSNRLTEVVLAGTFDEAVRVVRLNRRPFHCWILDVLLSDSHSGLELLQEFKGYSYAIALSGLCGREEAAEAMKLGARDFFDKLSLYPP